MTLLSKLSKNYFSLCFLLILIPAMPLSASKNIEISKDFTLFTSKNMQGYAKPLFTTIEQGWNSNMFTIAQYNESWSIGLDVSISGMIIPDDQTNFVAELPAIYGDTKVNDNATIRGNQLLRQVSNADKLTQPTIYGGTSYAVFSAPVSHYTNGYYSLGDTTFKSVAFVEGNNISMMPGIPNISLIAGFPTRTQLRIRGWGFPIQGELALYLGFMVNQQFDQFFDIFGQDTTMGLALNLAYSNFSRTEGLSMSSFSAGVHYSKQFEKGLAVFGAVQYEGLNGEFYAIKEQDPDNPQDRANSPYEEVRDLRPLKFDIESFTSFRILAGLSYKTGVVELHGDLAWASQPMVTFGLTFWIAEWGEKTKEKETIEQFEEIERIERVKKSEGNEKTREEEKKNNVKKK